MAQRRMPAEHVPPAELTVFAAEEWAAPSDESWRPGYERWREARERWAAAYPGALGNPVEMLSLTVRTRHAMMRRDWESEIENENQQEEQGK